MSGRSVRLGTLAVGLGLLLISCNVRSQDRLLLIISPRIGTEIDSLERLNYDLFPAVEEFQGASFYRLPDSTFWAWLLLRSPEENLRDSAYEVSPASLKQMADWIMYKREIIDGTYLPGVSEPRILYADGSVVVLPPVRITKASTRQRTGMLPLAENTSELSRPLFQTIHFDFSVGYGSAHFTDLSSLTGSTSNSFLLISFGFGIPLQQEGGISLVSG